MKKLNSFRNTDSHGEMLKVSDSGEGLGVVDVDVICWASIMAGGAGVGG